MEAFSELLKLRRHEFRPISGMIIQPVARFRSPFPSKFGIPRQAGLAPDLRGQILLAPPYRNEDTVRGLEGFDYLWLIWGFSDGERPFRATVRPPRLGGNTRVGVFASRSPFRPNRLGLSSVRIERIEYDAKIRDGKPDGPVIHVLGADLMDGTPIYDIKPYVEYTDSHEGVRCGFVDGKGWEKLVVRFPDPVRRSLPDARLAVLEQVLAQDPRPRYKTDGEQQYGMSFEDLEIRFRVTGRELTVLSISGADSAALP